MCLHAKQRIFGRAIIRKAKKDIVVYKTICKFSNRAPYQDDYVYYKGLNFPKIQCKQKHFECTCITSGWLHAYRMSHISNFNPMFDEEVKMVIPKGARYIIGNNGDICTSCLRWD